MIHPVLPFCVLSSVYFLACEAGKPYLALATVAVNFVVYYALEYRYGD